MNDLRKCPWCGADAEWVQPKSGTSGYARWECGSHKSGDEPSQVGSCRIAELERELHDAGDGDTHREACKRVEAELKRTREKLAKSDARVSELTKQLAMRCCAENCDKEELLQSDRELRQQLAESRALLRNIIKGDWCVTDVQEFLGDINTAAAAKGGEA